MLHILILIILLEGFVNGVTGKLVYGVRVDGLTGKYAINYLLCYGKKANLPVNLSTRKLVNL